MAEAAQINDVAEKPDAKSAEKNVTAPEAAKASDTKSSDAKPADAKSADAKSADAKSADAKPSATKAEAPAPVVAKKPAAKKAASDKTDAKAPAVAKSAVAASAKRKYVRKAPTAAKSAPVLKAKPVAVKVKPVSSKTAALKAPVTGTARTKIASSKPVAEAAKALITPATTLISKLKETKMVTTTKKTADDMTAKIQDSVKDVQARAKTALEKSQAMFGDAGEFTKGNIEAMVESGKIIATGVQAMGKTYVAEVKSRLETVQSDVKELRTVKSPTDFVKLQSTLMRKYFDNVVAYNSKSAEAALKLANDAFQPISSRVSLAVEKVKKAA